MRRLDCLAALLALGFPSAASAASFCVLNGAQFSAALDAAEDNAQDDLIRMQTGSFVATAPATGFSYFSTENFALTVRGGYRNDGGGPCSTQEESSTGTRIDGQGQRQGLSITGASGSGGLVTIERLTFSNGLHSTAGGGLAIQHGSEPFVDVVVNRVAFVRNISQVTGGGLAVTTGGTVRVSNSLFLGNECGNGACAAQLSISFNDPATLRLTFASNTVVGNECLAGATNCQSSGVRASGTARSRFHNNAFAFNDAVDLVLATGPATLVANNVLQVFGTPESDTFRQSVADPLFVAPLSDDYRLRYESPLRNAGQPLYFASLDLDGNGRPHEGVIDLGAYENVDALLIDGFEGGP